MESSKTDGSWIPLSRTPNITCPVNNLQRYAEFARISFDEHKHLFRGITKTRNYEKLRKTPLSYSRIRELVKEAFENIIESEYTV